MSLDLLFFNNTAVTIEQAWDTGETVSFTNDGFKDLINTGIFQLVTITTPSGFEAIDIKKNYSLLKEKFTLIPQNHTRNQLLHLLEKYDNVTGNL